MRQTRHVGESDALLNGQFIEDAARDLLALVERRLLGLAVGRLDARHVRIAGDVAETSTCDQLVLQ